MNPVALLVMQITSRISSFEVFTALIFQIEVFWFVTPCGLVDGY
jgi:hypothetical protein